MAHSFGIAAVVLTAATALWVIVRSQRRSTDEVLADLDDGVVGGSPSSNQNLRVGARRGIGRSAGGIVLSVAERRRQERDRRLFPICGACIGALLVVLLGVSSIRGVALGVGGGALLGWGIFARRAAMITQSYKRSLEFFLPMVMERIVMAVSAGLDIVPAVKVVIDLDEQSGEIQKNPVSRLLKIVYQLTESGLQFEDALTDVASSIDCSALRHAFIHLSLARKEGGELVMPLRELSDSTQLYYQESVEEEIAQMPVKATMPLLLTFAGLIICFISVPLMQVLSITQKARPQQGIHSVP